MIKNSDITESTLITLRDIQRILRSRRPSNFQRFGLEEDIIEELTRYVVESPFEIDLINYKNSPQACGCMGPREGFKICPCDIRGLLEDYNFEVAAKVRNIEC